MLSISNLTVNVNGQNVLNGVDLSVGKGEVHAIMGPNGAGKSSLAAVLAGHPKYEVVEGEIHFQGKNLLEMKIEERATTGLFLCFQYPVEIQGVSVISFLKESINSVRAANSLPEYDAAELLSFVRSILKRLGIEESILKRQVNYGFSGGERKLFEALQILLLQPRFVILDEADSGLDVDAMKRFSNALKTEINSDNSWLIITHYTRLLEYLRPDRVHMLINGKILKSGGPELAYEIEESGYVV